MATDNQNIEGIEVTAAEAEELGVFEEDALSPEEALSATEQEG